MEGIGMFSKTITELTNIIYQNSSIKLNSQVLGKAYSLGVPIKEDYSTQRITFTLSQVIINLIDEIVSSEKDYRMQQMLKRSKQKGYGVGQDTSLEGNSTLNNSPNCMAGNLHIAAQLFSIFCPKMSIWDILDRITDIKIELQREDAILQNIRLQNRIFYLPNLRSNFSCHCCSFNQVTRHHQELHCGFCACIYHGQCQSNIIYCNNCFLRFGIFDLKQEFNDPFNYNKEIQLCYFTYIENSYNYEHSPQHQCIYFYLVKFDLPQLNNVQKKEKAFYIKCSLVDKIYNTELELTLNTKRNKMEIKQFWDVDDIEYYFYLNHNEIKITQSISDFTVIFKVLPRILIPNNNILVIKAVKRNLKYNFTNSINYYRQQSENKKKIIMLGVYQTNKIKSQRQNKGQRRTPEIVNKSIVTEISYPQAMYNLQFTLKKINQIQYQIVDLIDVISKEKIINPVRSFGCTHIECFDFDEYKQAIKPKCNKTKLIKKNVEVRIDVDLDEINDEDNAIELDSKSVEILNNTQTITPPITTELPIRLNTQYSKREYWRKKKQKEKRQKKQKGELFCPICNKKMISLYFDPWFKTILTNSGFYTKAKIYKNGEFTFVNCSQEKIFRL